MDQISELKIVFAGPMGAGKTTAIAAISEIEPLRTEQQTSGIEREVKDTTTVALDYGEVSLSEGVRLKLFGVPGQLRFDFMWKSIEAGSLGTVFLMDNARADPLDDLAIFLASFASSVAAGRAVVGVGRMASHPLPTLGQYRERLTALGILLPILAVDVRERQDVILLLNILFNQIEFSSQATKTI